MDWVGLVKMVVPIVLPFVNPKLAPVGPLVVQGITEAQQMKGASGPEKLAHATNLVTIGAATANAAAGKEVVDTNAVTNDASKAISVAVDITNMLHKSQTPESTDKK